MELKRMEYDLTVCKVPDISKIDMTAGFCFIGKTDEEISLVCKTEDTPAETIKRDDGWKCFRILADHKIGIFAISTYNTDYILVKEENFDRALKVLESEGYTIV